MTQNPSDYYILSDLPTDVDALDFTPYVRTLINIVQSPNTATSLMRLVRRGLPEDFATIWFDAWKYDKEETLWRALLLQVLAAVRVVVEARQTVN